MAVSRSLVRSALAVVGARAAQAPRHPLFPAAVRLERSRSRHRSGSSRQTSWTLWFGAGPSLPPPGRSEGSRLMLRATAGVLTAAAVGAATVIAARREQPRPAARRIDVQPELPLLDP